MLAELSLDSEKEITLFSPLHFWFAVSDLRNSFPLTYLLCSSFGSHEGNIEQVLCAAIIGPSSIVIAYKA